MGINMPNIEINEGLWANTTEDEKIEVTAHLIKHGMLMPNDSVVGNPNVPDRTADAGFIDKLINGVGGASSRKTVRRIACDAAAAAAAAAVTLTGTAAAATYAAIDAASRNYKNSH
jgi:hypothetical protein